MTYETSPEMNHFINTGTCPRCGVFIAPLLDLRPWNERVKDILSQRAEDTSNNSAPPLDLRPRNERVKDIVSHILSQRAKDTSNNRVKIVGDDMQCMICMKTWPVYCEHINVASYQLIKVTGEQQTETVLSQETKLYSNQSSAKIKRRIGVTNTVSQTVTIEADKIRTLSAQASANKIFGWLNIQGQIQQQLGQRYSVGVQQTLSVNEEMEIAIPPFRTIEVVITWKTVWRKGNAVLGNGSLPMVEVPYWVPLRLSFDPVPRDVAPTRERS